MKLRNLVVLLIGTWFGVAAHAEVGTTNTNVVPIKPANTGFDLFGNEVVAKGKGVEVKRRQLDEAVISFKSTAAARGSNITPEQQLLLEQQLLEHLIQVQLLVGKADESEKAKGKESSEKRLEVIKGKAGTEDALNRQLKSVGMSQEDLLGRMRDEAT